MSARSTGRAAMTVTVALARSMVTDPTPSTAAIAGAGAPGLGADQARDAEGRRADEGARRAGEHENSWVN
jgi:hypothetical protein